MFVGVIENNNSVRTSGLDGLTSGPVGLHGHLDQHPTDVVGHVASQLTVCCFLIRCSFTGAPVQQVAAHGTTYLLWSNRAATVLGLDSVFSAGAVLINQH